MRDLSDDAFAMVGFDDGQGMNLYVAGEFLFAGAVEVGHIARWDGASWYPLGQGTELPAYALAVFDDGTGPALFAAGGVEGAQNTGFLAKWDGMQWTVISSGFDSAVRALAVYDDGTGQALYVGGYFSEIDGVQASRIAKWDGRTWSALDSGIDGTFVESLTVFDDGDGPELYAGGYFFTAGGGSAVHIARWDGQRWASLGEGTSRTVETMAVFDDGSGPALFVGGRFTHVEDSRRKQVNFVAKWDGNQWHALEEGVDGWVYSMAAVDVGNGPRLWIGGSFNEVGGEPTDPLVEWDGTSLRAKGSNIGYTPRTLTQLDIGQGSTVFAGGTFTIPGEANHIAQWDAGEWIGLSNPDQGGAGMSYFVHSFAELDIAGQSSLYVGGRFFSAGREAVYSVAQWQGGQWQALGAGADLAVQALAGFDDGHGPALYAGGYFNWIDGVEANGVAKWDGTAWASLGDGVEGTVFALRSFDDGSGPALYVAGDFTVPSAGAQNLARWDGRQWSAVGGAFDDRVWALTVFDDGGGPALYAGGFFDVVGSTTIRHIAKWDGSAWSSVGGNTTGSVHALVVHDDGSGPALYAGGSFSRAGTQVADKIARWDGRSWSPVGTSSGSVRVDSLTVFNEGNGPNLYAGGIFTYGGDGSSHHIARWDGSQWSRLGPGTNGAVEALHSFDDGIARSLFVGGRFTTAGHHASSFVGRYGCYSPPTVSIPDLTHVAADERARIGSRLEHGGRAFRAVDFSLDYDPDCLDPDVNQDGLLDDVEIHVPDDFTVSVQLDSLAASGKIDISIEDNIFPVESLSNGNLVTVGFQAVCSTDPDQTIETPLAVAPGLGLTTDLGQAVSGQGTDGVVRIWSGARGDCNGNGELESLDPESVVSELFDGDGEIWVDAPHSSFAGDPVGCDSNGDGVIRAADAICSNLLVESSSCATSPEAGIADLHLSARWEDGVAWIRFDVVPDEESRSSPLAGFALSLDLDSELFDLSTVDTNSDGVPDQIRWPAEVPDRVTIGFDEFDIDGEIDVFLAVTHPLGLSAGRVLEIGIPSGSLYQEGQILSQHPAPSFGSTTGVDLEAQALWRHAFFSDGFESGDTSAWAGAP